jgi:hypothetical protein
MVSSARRAGARISTIVRTQLGGQSWLTGGADPQRDGDRGGDGMVA